MESFKKKSEKGETRVASGFLRGRKILTPGAGTHPMGSREKLALFNMISPYLMRAMVLDAFSGSGALGIEALSRGARHVMFIESAREAVTVIRENLKRLGLLENSTVSPVKVANFFTSSEFDVIIADPPYDNFSVREIELLVRFLKPSGILVLSHPGEAPEVEGLKLEKTHAYAAAHISIYVK